jgi:hypothetical protein
VHGIAVTLLVLFAVILVFASEAGFRLGRKAEARAAGKTTPRLGAIEGGGLVLLGLLPGFTMSMAVGRYEARKQLVLNEANAIGTSHLRTRLLPDPERTEIASLLREYAFGLEGRRQVFGTSMLALVITVVFAVIIDLDCPRQGFMQVSQQPLIDLQRQLTAPTL